MLHPTTFLTTNEAAVARRYYRGGMSPWSIAAKLNCTLLALDAALMDEPGYKTTAELR